MIIVGPYRRVGLDLPGDFGLWVLEGDVTPVDDLARVVADTLRRTNEIMSGQMGIPELTKLEVVKASVPGQSVDGKGPAGLVLVEYGRGVSFRQDWFLQVFSHELVHQWLPGSTIWISLPVCGCLKAWPRTSTPGSSGMSGLLTGTFMASTSPLHTA